jgi:hypothetical protein
MVTRMVSTVSKLTVPRIIIPIAPTINMLAVETLMRMSAPVSFRPYAHLR